MMILDTADSIATGLYITGFLEQSYDYYGCYEYVVMDFPFHMITQKVLNIHESNPNFNSEGYNRCLEYVAWIKSCEGKIQVFDLMELSKKK